MQHTNRPPLPENLNLLKPKIIDGLTRVGNKGDGGYVIPEFVIGVTDALISLGVCDEWTFEEELLRRNQSLQVHAYDHTVGKRHFLRELLIGLLRLLILKESVREIARKTKILINYHRFFGGRCIHYRERAFNRKDGLSDATVDTIMSRLAEKKILMVKMDIECGEYRIINHLLEYKERIELLIVEFHDTDPLRETFLKSINAILGSYDIVHLHGNNYGGIAGDGLPEVLEVTFLRKGTTTSCGYRNRLPVDGLDAPNRPDKADYRIVFA